MLPGQRSGNEDLIRQGAGTGSGNAASAGYSHQPNQPNCCRAMANLGAGARFLAILR
jgi:hypothetical protein